MKCLYCEKEFKIIPTGKSGGMNRQLCYDCLPEGMSQDIIKTRAATLLVEKIRRHKESLGCSICGYNKNGAALDWHHLDPNEKDFNLSEVTSGGNWESWNRYLEETKKCILVCANCHREIHNPIKQIPTLIANNQEYEKFRQKVLELYQQYKTVNKVAEVLNHDERSIANILHYYNIDTSQKTRKVQQIDKINNIVINEYISLADASRAACGNESGTSHIVDVCNGKRKSAYGYKWKYIDDQDMS